jgi:hypothetical protein
MGHKATAVALIVDDLNATLRIRRSSHSWRYLPLGTSVVQTSCVRYAGCALPLRPSDPSRRASRSTAALRVAGDRNIM